jgi:hypothetical protein
MKVIPPLTVTSALLTSSTAAEPGPGETAWNAATSYTVGQRAIRTATHRVYQALVAGIDAGVPESTPSRWLDVGPTNRYAMFDLERNSATVAASTITVVITPGKRISAIALLGLVADQVDIDMTVGGLPVYSYSENLAARTTTTWTEYFYGEFGARPAVVRFDLPLHSAGVLTVTLSISTGNVMCGALCIGTAVDLGRVQINPRSDALNFSRIERDNFGSATLVPRRTVPKTTQTLLVDKGRVNKLIDVRTALNAAPAVWSGLDDATGDGYFDALLILGIYKQFSIDLSQEQHAIATLELEEI